MQITPVDNELNLFRVENVFSNELVQQVKDTDWLNLPWSRQPYQENWNRRRVTESSIPWIDQWNFQLSTNWSRLEEQLNIEIQPYCGTAFWIDEPGFVCTMHTDGELPGSLHLTWQGSGTSFYWHNDPSTLRYQVPSQPNAGYIMINCEDSSGYRKLLWHAMLDPVPVNTFRLTSYIWIIPK
jgi:hypothetical protein